jgi:hypothetical protein
MNQYPKKYLCAKFGAFIPICRIFPLAAGLWGYMTIIIPGFLIWRTFQDHRGQSLSGTVSRAHFVTAGAIASWNFVHMYP